MLCCLEPVKCCSRLPNWSGATIRTSTFSPVWVRSRTPDSLGVWAASTSSSAAAAWASASGSEAVAMMSRSLTLSVIRRAEPASSTRSAAGWARRASSSCSPTASARLSTTRRPPPLPSASSARWAAIAARMLSSALGPKPLSARICCAEAAASSASSESMESSSNSRRARLGPRPGSRVISSRPTRELGAQLDRRRDVAVVGQGQDLLLDDRADARQFGGATLAGQRGHRHRGVAHRLGRVAVGHDPVDDRPVELVEVAELVQRRLRSPSSWGPPWLLA